MISVVVRTKNEERWIGKCLAALREQDYPGLEIIVVDNESVDNTVGIVTEQIGFDEMVDDGPGIFFMAAGDCKQLISDFSQLLW